jgi:hypothetical protein
MARPRLQASELCNGWMPRARETCAIGAGHAGRCKTAESVRVRRVNQARHSAENSKSRKTYNKQYYSTVHGKAVHLLGLARHRAKAKGIPFDLTLEWMEAELESAVASGCPYLGISIHLNGGFGDPHLASVEQFNPGGGYTQDNCLIVSFKGNTMKNDCPPWLVEKFGRNVAQVGHSRFGGLGNA